MFDVYIHPKGMLLKLLLPKLGGHTLGVKGWARHLHGCFLVVAGPCILNLQASSSVLPVGTVYLVF